MIIFGGPMSAGAGEVPGAGAGTAAPPVLEIRIHGVSNTPPQFTLGLQDESQIERVAGDDSTAFYRRVRPLDPTVDTQAYSWGQLTGGVRAKKDLSRGLWMTLLPFAFANVGFWARKNLPGRQSWTLSETTGVASFFSRLFALSLTVTLSLAATGVSVDLLAWQWLGYDDPTQVRWVTQLAFLHDGWWSHGTRPLAAALAVPLAVMLLVWLVARRSFQYEATVQHTGPAGPVPSEPTEVSAFESRWFWRGETQARRLAWLHLVAGISAACLMTLAPVGLGRATVPEPAGRWIARAIVVALVLVLLLCATSLLPSDVTVRQAPGEASGSWQAMRALVILGFALAVPATVIYLCALPGIGLDRKGHLDFPGYSESVLLLFAAQFLLLIGLAAGQRWTSPFTVGLVLVLLLMFWFVAANTVDGLPLSSWLKLDAASGRSELLGGHAVFWVVAVPLTVLCALVLLVPTTGTGGADAGGQAWRLLGGPLLMMLGWLLALLYSSGVLFFAADWLSNGLVGPDGRPRVELPLPFQWAALGLPFFLVAVVIAAGWTMYFISRRGRAYREARGATGLTTHERRRELAVTRHRAFHDFMQDRLLTYIGVLMLFAVVEVVLGISVATTRVDVGWAGPWAGPVRNVGVRLSLLLLLFVMLLGTLVYRADPRRRGVAIIWDLATFWPRAGHPLAPPCYAERCVPQLVTRIANDVDHRPGYVLSGHSQGAVLAVATILQLPESKQARVFLLSYGTQLRALYGRVFPFFFGPTELEAIGGKLVGTVSHPTWLRWRSLYRPTDPLGYPVKVVVPNVGGELHVDERPLVDPTGLAPPRGDIEDPPIRGHSDYNRDVVFVAVTAGAVARLRQR